MWIELHQSLWTHKKTLLLAAELGIDETYAAAHMARLWSWALDNAPNGELGNLPNKVIAYGAGWRGDPDRFVEAAIRIGWLDQTPNGLLIHDWEDYAGRLIERREAARERMRKVRERNRASLEDGSRTLCERSANVQESSENGSRTFGVTVPNLTDDVCTIDDHQGDTPGGISTEGPGSPDPLYVKVEQAYVELTGRFVSPNDITAISQTIKDVNGDIDFIISVMRKAANNFKPKWEGHRISSFGYFRQVILGELAKRKAWEESRRDGTSSRDSPESTRSQIRDATPEEIERYIEQCRQLTGGQLPE